MKIQVRTTQANGLPAMNAAEYMDDFDSHKRTEWNSSARKWLVNHIVWAMANGQMVVITPESN